MSFYVGFCVLFTIQNILLVRRAIFRLDVLFHVGRYRKEVPSKDRVI